MSDSDYNYDEGGSRSRSRSSSSNRYRRRKRERSRSSSRSSAPPIQEDEPNEGGPDGSEEAMIQFCSVHKVDLEPDGCNVCHWASKYIKPEMLAQLVKRGTSKVGTAEELPSAAD